MSEFDDLFDAVNWVYKIKVALYVGAACAIGAAIGFYLFT
jgi:hypothetical protein